MSDSTSPTRRARRIARAGRAVDALALGKTMHNAPDAGPFGLRILGSPDEPPRTTRRRVELLLGGLIISSNLVGVIVVFVLAAFVVPGPEPADVARVAVLNIILGSCYTAVFVLAGIKWGKRAVDQQTEWLYGDRPPTEAEQRSVLQIPLMITGAQGFFWLAGAWLFAAFNALIGDHLTVQIALTISMGGLLTCANSYVVGELLTRPLAARALAFGPPARLQVPGVQARAFLAWLLSSAVPVIGLMVVAAVALVRTGITTTRLAVTVLVLGGVTLLFGSRITALSARANADPIRGLRRAFQSIAQGDFDVSVPIYDGTEIGQLQAGFNQMAAGLRERERIRRVFEHHVGVHVAKTALEGDGLLGGTTCQAGVLFVDVIESSALARRLAPDEVVALLNQFFAVVVDEVVRHGGLVNKFEGDGALAVFGAPVPLDDPAGAALAAGRELAARLRDETRGFEAGIGISAGTVVAGNVGAPNRYEYTVIGDPVNEASRLTELAKGTRGRLVASWNAVVQASPSEAAHWDRTRDVRLRGRPGRTQVAAPRR